LTRPEAPDEQIGNALDKQGLILQKSLQQAAQESLMAKSSSQKFVARNRAPRIGNSTACGQVSHLGTAIEPLKYSCLGRSNALLGTSVAQK
jgi:hypothetical protein